MIEALPAVPGHDPDIAIDLWGRPGDEGAISAAAKGQDGVIALRDHLRALLIVFAAERTLPILATVESHLPSPQSVRDGVWSPPAVDALGLPAEGTPPVAHGVRIIAREYLEAYAAALKTHDDSIRVQLQRDRTVIPEITHAMAQVLTETLTRLESAAVKAADYWLTEIAPEIRQALTDHAAQVERRIGVVAPVAYLHAAEDWTIRNTPTRGFTAADIPSLRRTLRINHLYLKIKATVGATL